MNVSAMISGGLVLSLGALVVSAQARPPARTLSPEAGAVPIVGRLQTREGTFSLTATSISAGGEAHGYVKGVAVEMADLELAEPPQAETCGVILPEQLEAPAELKAPPPVR